ncbi:prepilin-type N-terminal cleavage/methylation domain-containing protein [Desulfomicrobium sp. ZS1]|uniref:prepilin-type N-terminal cleavage/methylation domain-containing protein n=1 Tax=Desulfomicrobium sp. ZS1 TaxID=2952228 RepID=UPI00273A6A60|nr:prepilin-type N-terminal cleavage/methylation domain-containing protein [Desulfomicrobium sp. ZS1]
MNRFRKNEKGFTLVELLIVVAIIGILAAIAIPQFTKYKKGAAEKACVASIKTCITELSARYADNSSDDEFDCLVDGDNSTLTVEITGSGEIKDITAGTKIDKTKTNSGYTLTFGYANATGIIDCEASN